MPMSHTNYKNVIKGLGGDPIRFLLLLVHTLNVFINKFASGARNFFFYFSMSHCHKRYRSEEISPKAADEDVQKTSFFIFRRSTDICIVEIIRNYDLN